MDEDMLVEGIAVGLFKLSKLVGKGKIISVDETRICHHALLGSERVLIALEEVIDKNMKHDDTELLVNMIGSFLPWKKMEVQALSKCHNLQDITKYHRESQTSSNLEQRRTCAPNNMFEGTPPEVLIPRAMWLGMKVTVLGTQKIAFAVATIQVLNPLAQLGETMLGDSHVGILFQNLLEGALTEHLKY